MSDDELRRAVSRSQVALQQIVRKAEERLDEMQKEMQKKLKEQQDIVTKAVEMRNAYNRESVKWELSANRSLRPESTYPIERVTGEYSKGLGIIVTKHYPWRRTVPPPPPAPAPAPRPKRQIDIDDDASEEEEVTETGRTTWAKRDAALRKQAVSVDSDSCVDEVFRNFNVSIR